MKHLMLIGAAFIMLTACSKRVENITNQPANPVDTTKAAATDTTPPPAASAPFVKYTILKGAQYSNDNGYQTVSYDDLKFVVKFDSSAIYQTVSPSNQHDINKLYGFSDNNAQHHLFSARFGWRWSENALRLFAYVYNNGTMTAQEIGTVQIGAENHCSIKVDGNKYIFTLNETTLEMPRASTTPKAEGYRLYPFFGGDELAPHEINIWIKEL